MENSTKGSKKLYNYTYTIKYDKDNFLDFFYHKIKVKIHNFKDTDCNQ